MRLVRCALVSGAFALIGCGSSDEGAPGLGSAPRHPVPGCESFDPAPCDVLDAECQTRLFGLAGCLRGNEPSELPPVSVMTEAEHEADLRQWFADNPPSPDLEHFEAGYAMLGLVEPGAFGEDARVADLVRWIAGFYSYETKAIVIVEREDGLDLESSSAVLVHEFVHALQDRDVDLQAYSAAHGDTSDADWAANAVSEGEAWFHEQHYLASMLGFDPAEIDWDKLFSNGVTQGEQRLFELDSVLRGANSVFPYEWGARYVHLGWSQTGHAGVLDLFAAPPPNTHQLMQSDSEIVAESVTPAAIPEPVAPSEWTPIGTDTLGALGTFLTLGRLTEIELASRYALAWRGDKLTFYAGAETAAGDPNTTAIVWSADFADADSAQRVAGQLQAGFGTTNVRIEGTRITYAASNDGANLDWAFAPRSP